MTDRKCIICGILFQPKTHNHVCCSPECSQKRNLQHIAAYARKRAELRKAKLWPKDKSRRKRARIKQEDLGTKRELIVALEPLSLEEKEAMRERFYDMIFPEELHIRMIFADASRLGTGMRREAC